MVAWLVNKEGAPVSVAPAASFDGAGGIARAGRRQVVSMVLGMVGLFVLAATTMRQALDTLVVRCATRLAERLVSRHRGLAWGGEGGQGIVEYIIIIAIIVGIIIFVLVKFVHILGTSFHHVGNCVSNPTSCATGNPVHG